MGPRTSKPFLNLDGFSNFSHEGPDVSTSPGFPINNSQRSQIAAATACSHNSPAIPLVKENNLKWYSLVSFLTIIPAIFP